MKNCRMVLVLMMSLLLAMAGTVSAADTGVKMDIPTIGDNFFVQSNTGLKTIWLSDPKTGAQIGYVLKSGWENVVPISASWTGPVVGGKAEGKGVLSITLKRQLESQVIQYLIQGEAGMAGGMLDGAASLKNSMSTTILSTGEKLFNVVTFDGIFAAGLEEGQGKSAVNNKTLFDGQWKAGQEDSGYLASMKGRIFYEGEIRNGKGNGTGKVTFRSQGWYQGEFKDGKYEGQGVFRWSTSRGGDLMRPDEIAGGASFQGLFSNDKPNGYGVFKDGRGQVIYAGEWKDGKPINQ